MIMKRISSRIDVDKNDLSGEINSVISQYFSLKEMESKNSDDKQTNNEGDVQNFMDEEKENNKTGSQLVMSNSVSYGNK